LDLEIIHNYISYILNPKDKLFLSRKCFNETNLGLFDLGNLF